MGIEPYLINSSLICVMAERLVRKVCSHCKETYVVKDAVIESLKLDRQKIKNPEFLRGKGCSHCFNTGYSGRIGIAEVLILSPAIRELILSCAQEHIIKQQARKEGMKTLRENGIDAALRGLTSLEEVLRVTALDE
jgi:type II secretory ATPase GspE/PulE/Tfp pilus assembly ATPase PilB-like protein